MGMKLTDLLAIAAFTLPLVACATPMDSLTPQEREEITSRTIPADYKTVFQATIAAFQDDGWVVSEASFEGGIIDTDWRTDDWWREAFVGKLRMKLNASLREVEGGTRVRVMPSRQGGDLFGDWDDKGVTAGRAKEICDHYFAAIARHAGVDG